MSQADHRQTLGQVFTGRTGIGVS